MATGRFAPSPSGPMHLGNLRTALAAWLFARSAGSRFLLRVEDLDVASCREEHVEAHQRDLRTLGLEWDGAVVRQSARLATYEAALARLDDGGLLYPCYCTRREVLEAAQAPHDHLPEGAYPGTCRRLTGAERAQREAAGRLPAWRLHTAGEVVGFVDRVAGPYEGVLDDFVVRRRDGTPAYNLAVVVDDADQGIEEVVRGDDLVPTTPRQIHLAGLLDLPVPTYAHVPLVLGSDGERLAKRHVVTGLDERLARGEAPAEVLALLAGSLGLDVPDVRAGGEVEELLGVLVTRFDPDRLPRDPWTLPGS